MAVERRTAGKPLRVLSGLMLVPALLLIFAGALRSISASERSSRSGLASPEGITTEREAPAQPPDWLATWLPSIGAVAGGVGLMYGLWRLGQSNLPGDEALASRMREAKQARDEGFRLSREILNANKRRVEPEIRYFPAISSLSGFAYQPDRSLQELSETERDQALWSRLDAKTQADEVLTEGEAGALGVAL